jgi:hypothetical protein
MINDELVKCPLCHSFAPIENPELLAALNDPRIRGQVEEYVAQLLNAPLDELVNAAAGKPEAGDFQKDVHSWNPFVPTWRKKSERVSPVGAALSFCVVEPTKKEKEEEESYASQQAAGLGLSRGCTPGKN